MNATFSRFFSQQAGVYRARLKTIRTIRDFKAGTHTELVFEIPFSPRSGVVIRYACPGIPNPERSVARHLGRLSDGQLPTDSPDAESAFLEVDYELTLLPDRETGRLRIASIRMCSENQ